MVGRQEERDLLERVSGISNAFLLAPTFSNESDEWCIDLLDRGTDGSVVYVVTGADIDGRLASWRGRDTPRQVGFLVAGDTSRTSAASDQVPGIAEEAEIVVKTVENPGNLTKIGVELNTFLTEWAADGSDLSICFETLTPLIQYSDIEKVYQFLNVFTNHVTAVGAVAHYHLDPGAHDPTDVNLLKTNFDAVVEADDEGGVHVRTR